MPYNIQVNCIDGGDHDLEEVSTRRSFMVRCRKCGLARYARRDEYTDAPFYCNVGGATAHIVNPLALVDLMRAVSNRNELSK